MNKEKNILNVVKIFLENPKLTIKEISEITGISSSSVQRYLNDPIIKEIFNDETFEKIHDLLNQNKLTARRKGGINSFQNNEPIKDQNGRFIAVKKATNNCRLEKKCNDILIFANIFLRNSNLSLQQIADFYNENYNLDYNKPVTRDYVYDCLNSKDSYELLANDLYEVISKQLKERRIVGNVEGANITNKRK